LVAAGELIVAEDKVSARIVDLISQEFIQTSELLKQCPA
jgi:hypothetical protein